MKQLFHNEDCTQFFYTRQIPEGKAGELIDRYVDVMAEAGVTSFLVNTQGRRTNYRSRAWEALWDGYDPAGPDDQPFLKAVPKDDISRLRSGVGNMLAVHRQGVDYPARVIRRCRQRGMSPWITLRMNDCHCNDNMEHPFHGAFWKNNPQFYRKNATGYFARCLDYAHREVRDYFMSIISETLEMYDIDGLELDFMREPYLFSAGREAEGAAILTGWLREVRGRAAAAAAKLGHPVRLGVRVPSRPETAAGMGLDAEAWAREGLIDLLVPTPRWATLEFDMPVREWRKIADASNVTLAGGLEIGYRPYIDGRTWQIETDASPELAAGAAMMILSQGADAVYLFNYFQPGWGLPVYLETLNAMGSLESLKKIPRTIAITHRDIVAPGETYRPPLPAKGRKMAFQMNLGPVPDKTWNCSLLIGLEVSKDDSAPAPDASVNGNPCKVLSDTKTHLGPVLVRVVTFSVPMAALAQTEANSIKLASRDAMTVNRVEVAFRPPDQALPGDPESHAR